MSLGIVVEGETDRPVAEKLVRDAGLDVHTVIPTRGKANLDRNLPGYNRAARFGPWFVLRDMDSDARCAGEIVSNLLARPERWMTLRLAVREVESWLLADADGLAKFLGIRPDRIPRDPDAESDPKVCLANLARHSPSRARQAMAPLPNRSTQVGPLYAAQVIQFATDHWNVQRAARRSSSLERARKALDLLATNWRRHVGG